MLPRCVLILFLAFTGLLLADEPAPLSLAFQSDGSASVENGLIRLRINNGTGRSDGIRGWFFKPTGYEMVDVLYRAIDADGGHLLGLIWDVASVGDLPKGAPDVGKLFIPRVAAVDDTGRGALLRQVSEGTYRLTRTLTFRRDLAMVEAHFRLENIAGAPSGAALRLHNVLSPGARGQYQSSDGQLFMQLAPGPTSWQQGLPLDVFTERHGGDRAILPIVEDEPATIWTRTTESTPVLAGHHAVLVTPENGDGLAIMVEPDRLLGYYNYPNTTVEPLLRGFALDRGESWEARVWLGTFTGAKSKVVVDATPLYVATQLPRVTNGRLRGEVIPLFQGTLRLLDGEGEAVQEHPAVVEQAIVLDAPLTDEGWTLVALDQQGDEIGRRTAAGEFFLYQPDVSLTPPPKPAVNETVYQPEEQAAIVHDFIAGRDFVIQCDHTVSEPVRELARDLALHLGVGFAETPRFRGKMITFGSPGRSVMARNAGLLKNSVDAHWPGAGRGAILHYANFESTQEPLVLVTGSDAEGALAAAQVFRHRFVANLPAASGWRLWATPLSTYARVWVRPETAQAQPAIRLSAARNEYESAQLVLTPYEPLKNIEATVEPLLHAETGEEISSQFVTPFRRRQGSTRLRWAEPFPLNTADGWPGTPDALLDRPVTNLPAGQSQVLWLTLTIASNARPGLYRSAVQVTANGTTQRIPLELQVREFTLPLTGVKGEAYMAMHLMDTDGVPSDWHVDRLTRLLVEHHFRIFHLTEPQMVRWHISKDGAFKGIQTDFLYSNHDGTLLLDTSRLDHVIDRCDLAATPFELEYALSIGSLLDWPNGIIGFERAFPERFADRPPRESTHHIGSYWAQEMLGMVETHINRRGLRDRILVKLSDEPPGFDFWWDRYTEAVRATNLRFGTAFNAIDWDQAQKAIGSNLAQFQPLYQRFDPDFARRAQAAGHEMGWYNCGPPPHIGVGTAVAEFRAYYWQAARYDLDFVARWGIQCWGSEGTNPHNVWTFPYAHHHSVFYPEHPDKPRYLVEGRGWIDMQPLESIRSSLIREGHEDANYVWLLRRLIEQAEAAGEQDAADEANAVLERIWQQTFPTLNHYNPPYTAIISSREQVAQAIVALQQAVAK